MEIYIPFNTSSSKNSKEIFQMPVKGAKKCQCCGHMKKRPILVNSKTVKKYKELTKEYYIKNKPIWLKLTENLSPPYRVSFKFIRDSKRKFDYINAAQIVQDLMQEYGWVEDDNCDHIIPHFEPYEVDKERAGVIIKVL